MNTYSIFLHAHSGFRWLLLLFLVVVLIKSVLGMAGSKSFDRTDRILATSTIMLYRLQFILGLTLYLFLSPYTQQAFADFGAAMKNGDLRFWAVEHLVMMFGAIALAEFGSSRVKKVQDDSKKYKNQLIYLGISLLLILVSIPWDRV